MTTTQKLIQRIDELETKLMFQDDVIDQLNECIIKQQKDIKALTQLIEKTNAQLQDIRQPDLIEAHLETPPPHY